MSEGENSVGGISDISNLSDDEELNLGTLKAPPSRGNLEKETGRLRLKYKILREALVEEKLTKVDQEIEDIETGRNPAVQEELDALETRRKERTTMAYERKRVQVDAIVSDYKAKVQAFQDEQAAIDVELLGATQKQSKGSDPSARESEGQATSEEDAKALEKDLVIIRDADENAAQDSRDLVHSD